MVDAHSMSEITVDSGDNIYAHLKSFLAVLHHRQGSRRLQAETKTTSTWEVNSEVIEGPSASVYERKIKFHNFSKEEAQSQPKFTPGLGKHIFWHGNVLFILKSQENTLFGGVGSGKGPNLSDKKTMTLQCLGRPTNPIKKFLSDATNHYY